MNIFVVGIIEGLGMGLGVTISGVFILLGIVFVRETAFRYLYGKKKEKKNVTNTHQ